MVRKVDDVRPTIERLLLSNVSGYTIHKHTGISQSKISRLRSELNGLDDITLITAERLYALQKKLENENSKEDILDV